jgi:hypothetical protein
MGELCLQLHGHPSEVFILDHGYVRVQVLEARRLERSWFVHSQRFFVIEFDLGSGELNKSDRG